MQEERDIVEIFLVLWLQCKYMREEERQRERERERERDHADRVHEPKKKKNLLRERWL